MKIKKLFFLFLFFFLWESLLLCKEKKFEIEFLGNLNFPVFDGKYSYIYSPPFSPGAYLSSSELSLSYESKNKKGFGAGINYFFHENVGVRFEANYYRTSLEGESSKYNIYLQYISMQPPSYIPRLSSYQTSLNWEPADGDFTRLNANINLIYRVKMEHGISFDILSGISYEISKLDLRSLGYTKFWLGGHSVLFSETYKIEFSSGSVKDFGLVGGGTLNLPLIKNFDLSFGLRYFYFPTRFASIVLKSQTNKGETIEELETYELEQIKKLMKLPLLESPNSYYALRVSLRLKF